MFKRMRPIVAAGMLGTAAVIVAAKYGDQYQILLMLTLTLPLTFLFALARGVRRYVTLSMAVTMFGVSWIGVTVAHAVLLRDLRTATAC